VVLPPSSDHLWNPSDQIRFNQDKALNYNNNIRCNTSTTPLGNCKSEPKKKTHFISPLIIMFISSSYASNTSTTEKTKRTENVNITDSKNHSLARLIQKYGIYAPYACILHHYLLLTTYHITPSETHAVSYRRLCPSKPAPKQQNDLAGHHHHDHRYIYAISS
jgi:hypothetical protein